MEEQWLIHSKGLFGIHNCKEVLLRENFSVKRWKILLKAFRNTEGYYEINTTDHTALVIVNTGMIFLI